MEEKGENIHFVRNLYTFADFAYDEMASLEVWVLIDCCLVVTCLLASVHYWKSASFLEERERELTIGPTGISWATAAVAETRIQGRT